MATCCWPGSTDSRACGSAARTSSIEAEKSGRGALRAAHRAEGRGRPVGVRADAARPADAVDHRGDVFHLALDRVRLGVAARPAPAPIAGVHAESLLEAREDGRPPRAIR